jgi:P27 family predicted phage terminase small subunit
MGARGPKPLPTAIKKARGTFRPDRAPSNEPRATGRPAVPDWLTAEEQSEFRRLSSELRKMGVIGKVDAAVLARYIRTWRRWRQAEQQVEKIGMVTLIKDAKGGVSSVVQSPYVKIASQLSGQLDRLEQVLGLTPSARSRLEVSPVTETAVSDLADFLNQ